MPETYPRGLLVAAACAAALLSAPASAGAVAVTGGVSLTSETPQVSQVACVATACARGEVLRVTGTKLQATKLVAFLGKATTTRDDRRARPVSASDGELTVQVPSQAVSGPVQLTTTDGEKIAAAPKLLISGTAAQTRSTTSAAAAATRARTCSPRAAPRWSPRAAAPSQRRSFRRAPATTS